MQVYWGLTQVPPPAPLPPPTPPLPPSLLPHHLSSTLPLPPPPCPPPSHFCIRSALSHYKKQVDEFCHRALVSASRGGRRSVKISTIAILVIPNLSSSSSSSTCMDPEQISAFLARFMTGGKHAQGIAPLEAPSILQTWDRQPWS